MTVGENPKKIKNIVGGNIEQFRSLYRKPIEECSEYLKPVGSSYTLLSQDKSPLQISNHISKLPTALTGDKITS